MSGGFLRLDRLGVGYGPLQVVWDIDLHVETGEWVALLGPSSAGKSTLLKALAGLLPVKAGRILLDGEDVSALPPHRRVPLGIVLVPEGRRLFSGLSVEDNLRLGAITRRDTAEIERRLAFVHDLFPVLAARRRQIVGTLSGGEQQMCAVGRGLMSGPRLLVVDELSFGLAPAVVEELLEKLSAIRASGTSLFVVDQDVTIGLANADRGYIMRHGRLVREGRAADLLAAPELLDVYLGEA